MSITGNLKKGMAGLLVMFVSFGPSGGFVQAAPAVTTGGTGSSSPAESAPNDGSITLDFKDADINTVLRVLSIKSAVNIVAGPEVSGTVTIRLENVPWEKALDVVLRTYDYVYERDGNIIRVTTREKMAQEPVITQTYVLNYTRASEVRSAIQDMLTERGRMRTADRTNALVITDIPTNLYRIGQIVGKLDKITPQAYIDSKVINTQVQESENLGIQWNTGGNSDAISLSGSSRPVTFPFAQQTDGQERVAPWLSQFYPNIVLTASPNTADATAFPFPTVNNATNSGFSFGTLSFTGFSSVLQMLRLRSNTKVVSNPRIVVLNNQTASIQVGNDIPLPSFERNETTGSVEISGFTFREVGVVLNVTPHINSAEEILVELAPEISSRSGQEAFGTFNIPSFAVTRASTQVLIKSGETIAIGGLLTDAVAIADQRVPFLSDIPFVGKLFRSKRQTPGTTNQKSETLFFVTVTMVDSVGQPTDSSKSEDQYKFPVANPADSSEKELTKEEVPTNNDKATTPVAPVLKSPEEIPTVTSVSDDDMPESTPEAA